jgi:hypothetical protein
MAVHLRKATIGLLLFPYWLDTALGQYSGPGNALLFSVLLQSIFGAKAV